VEVDSEVMTARSLIRWLPATLALPLATIPAAAWAEEPPPALYHLAGSIDPGVKLQAELRIGKEAIDGRLVRSGDDRPLTIDGTLLANGRTELYLRGDFDQLRGSIHGTLVRGRASGRRVIIGEWRDGDGGNPRPVELDEVASYVTLVGRRGGALEVTCRYPFLLGEQAQVAEMNRRVQSEAMAWLDKVLAAKPSGPSSLRELRFDDTVVDSTPRLLSRLVRIETRDGTAPPHVRYQAENLEVKDGQLVPMRLGELFRAGSPYLQSLSARATEELRRVVKPAEVKGALALLGEDDLQVFTVSPSALQFVIPSARAGTPGPSDVLVSVPLSSLAGLLDPAGPLGPPAAR
jgi:hypothetical protein